MPGRGYRVLRGSRRSGSPCTLRSGPPHSIPLVCIKVACHRYAHTAHAHARHASDMRPHSRAQPMTPKIPKSASASRETGGSAGSVAPRCASPAAQVPRAPSRHPRAQRMAVSPAAHHPRPIRRRHSRPSPPAAASAPSPPRPPAVNRAPDLRWPGQSESSAPKIRTRHQLLRPGCLI